MCHVCLGACFMRQHSLSTAVRTGLGPGTVCLGNAGVALEFLVGRPRPEFGIRSEVLALVGSSMSGVRTESQCSSTGFSQKPI